MARSRQTKRKVLIRFIGRDPNDPMELLEAVEDVFRPKDVEISVEQRGDLEEPPSQYPNEQLETLINNTIAKALDAKDSQRREPGDHEAAKQLRTSIRQWVRARLLAGWRIITAVLPVLDKIKKLFD